MQNSEGSVLKMTSSLTKRSIVICIRHTDIFERNKEGNPLNLATRWEYMKLEALCIWWTWIFPYDSKIQTLKIQRKCYNWAGRLNNCPLEEVSKQIFKYLLICWMERLWLWMSVRLIRSITLKIKYKTGREFHLTNCVSPMQGNSWWTRWPLETMAFKRTQLCSCLLNLTEGRPNLTWGIWIHKTLREIDFIIRPMAKDMTILK